MVNAGIVNITNSSNSGDSRSPRSGFKISSGDRLYEFALNESSKLGKGNITVYKGVMKKKGTKEETKVAVKVFEFIKTNTNKSEKIAKLETEVKILRQLYQQNVAKNTQATIHIYDAFMDDRSPNYTYFYIIMEKAEGTLNDYVATYVNDELSKQMVMYMLAKKLHQIHNNGIIHCDIKPENILHLNESEDSLRFADFGISCKLEPDSATTCEGLGIGTFGYMDPQTVLGNAQHSASSDVFSLGAVFFEILYSRKFIVNRITNPMKYGEQYYEMCANAYNQNKIMLIDKPMEEKKNSRGKAGPGMIDKIVLKMLDPDGGRPDLGLIADWLDPFKKSRRRPNAGELELKTAYADRAHIMATAKKNMKKTSSPSSPKSKTMIKQSPFKCSDSYFKKHVNDAINDILELSDGDASEVTNDDVKDMVMAYPGFAAKVKECADVNIDTIIKAIMKERFG